MRYTTAKNRHLQNQNLVQKEPEGKMIIQAPDKGTNSKSLAKRFHSQQPLLLYQGEINVAHGCPGKKHDIRMTPSVTPTLEYPNAHRATSGGRHSIDL